MVKFTQWALLTASLVVGTFALTPSYGAARTTARTIEPYNLVINIHGLRQGIYRRKNPKTGKPEIHRDWGYVYPFVCLNQSCLEDMFNDQNPRMPVAIKGRPYRKCKDKVFYEGARTEVEMPDSHHIYRFCPKYGYRKPKKRDQRNVITFKTTLNQPYIAVGFAHDRNSNMAPTHYCKYSVLFTSVSLPVDGIGFAARNGQDYDVWQNSSMPTWKQMAINVRKKLNNNTITLNISAQYLSQHCATTPPQHERWGGKKRYYQKKYVGDYYFGRPILSTFKVPDYVDKPTDLSK